MLRVSDQAKLGQSDTILKYADKVGIKPEDITKVMDAFSTAKDAYKSASTPKTAPVQTTVAPTQTSPPGSPGTGIGVLPIIAVVAGLGIVLFAFLKR